MQMLKETMLFLLSNNGTLKKKKRIEKLLYISNLIIKIKIEIPLENRIINRGNQSIFVYDYKIIFHLLLSHLWQPNNFYSSFFICKKISHNNNKMQIKSDCIAKDTRNKKRMSTTAGMYKNYSAVLFPFEQFFFFF